MKVGYFSCTGVLQVHVVEDVQTNPVKCIKWIN